MHMTTTGVAGCRCYNVNRFTPAPFPRALRLRVPGPLPVAHSSAPVLSPTAGLAWRGGLSRCRTSLADERLGSLLLLWGVLNSATWAYVPVCRGGAGVSVLEPWWPGPAAPRGVFEVEHFHGHGSIPLPVFTRVGSLQPHKPGGMWDWSLGL